MEWIFQKENHSIRIKIYYPRYFDHMVIGMPRQLHDGMLEFEDGTPASTPQMANDVANFITFMQRRTGHRRPDK